ncbi:MAG: type II secretion system protein [Oceanospirillaceae bacterium]|nr:type II secretion system protein [Oceanospirillaceae bacterium]
MKAPVSESGFTLIESIFTIVIIAIAMTGIVAVWSSAVSRSADPLWQSQTASLGKFYVAQVHATPFAALVDYEGEIKTLSGDKVAGYAGFSVKIAVVNAGEDFSLPAAALKKVEVVISTSVGGEQHFVTYRGQY